MTVGAVVVIGLAALVGCSARSDVDRAADEAAEDGDAGAGAVAADEDAATGAAGDGGTATPLEIDTVAVARREVVRTGEMRLEVDDVEAAADSVRSAVGDAGGFVAGEQATAEQAHVDMTVRVPAAEFESVRATVSDLGEVVEQTVEARDVTAEVVDVETRVGSLRASVERLQDLLGGAGDVAQLAAVEGELSRREAELEALLAQQRLLRDQVDLATLRLELSEQRRPEPDEDVAGFGDGLRRGWVLAIDGGRLALAAVGFLLPFGVPAVLVALAVRWALRLRSPRPRR